MKKRDYLVIGLAMLIVTVVSAVLFTQSYIDNHKIDDLIDYCKSKNKPGTYEIIDSLKDALRFASAIVGDMICRIFKPRKVNLM